MKRVAIIGGGAAGLCMARHFAAHPKMFQPIIYEETSSVGGTWTYEDKSVNDPIVQVVQVNSKGNSTQKTDNSFHSSMYKGLRSVCEASQHVHNFNTAESIPQGYFTGSQGDSFSNVLGTLTNATTTTQIQSDYKVEQSILHANRFVLTRDWSLSWSQLAQWIPG